MMKKLVTTILLAMALQPINLLAQQCEVANTAFKEGESVRYDLYFDWGIIWKKVGYATFSTEKTIYEGQPAYDIRLMAVGSKEADMLFKLRDSLQVYMTERLEPLYYKKAAEEGNPFAFDVVAMCYEEGIGTEKDPKLADFWKEKAKETLPDFTSEKLRNILKFKTVIT